MRARKNRKGDAQIGCARPLRQIIDNTPALVPQLSSSRAWGVRFDQLLASTQFDSAVRSDEARSAMLLHGLPGVGPGKRVSHRSVVVIHKLPQLRFQVLYRLEVSAPQKLPVDDPEDDFDLVEPRTVLREVDEADPVAGVR